MQAFNIAYSEMYKASKGAKDERQGTGAQRFHVGRPFTSEFKGNETCRATPPCQFYFKHKQNFSIHPGSCTRVFVLTE